VRGQAFMSLGKEVIQRRKEGKWSGGKTEEIQTPEYIRGGIQKGQGMFEAGRRKGDGVGDHEGIQSSSSFNLKGITGGKKRGGRSILY